MVEYAEGIDVSRYQGTIDWTKVAASGIRFAYIRSSIGSIYKDPRFIENWNGAKEAGILVTAYHVIRWDYTAEAQLKNFMQQYDSVKGAHDLPIVFDVELPVPAGGSFSHQQTITVTSQLMEFLADLNPIDGAEGYDNTMIYTGAWWWVPAYKYWLPSNTNKPLPQWLATAHYVDDTTAFKPPAYAPWDDWAMWQYSSSGSVPGIEGKCDLDKVDKASKFYELYIENKVPEPPPPPEPPEPECIVINSDKPITVIIN